MRYRVPIPRLSSTLTRRLFFRKYLHSFRQALEQNDKNLLKVLATQIPPQEFPPLLRHLPPQALHFLFSALPPTESAKLFRHFREEERREAFQYLGTKNVSPILLALPPDEQVDFLQSLSPSQREQILNSLPEATRAQIRELAQYPKDTAGGIMSPQVITVQESMTCQEAIEEIRRRVSGDGVFYVYATDTEGKLRGVLELRKLFTHSPEAKIQEIMLRNVVYVEATLDQEEVVQVFQRYDLLALPVVDSEKKLLGVITADDAMEVMEEELEEDIFKMVGTEASELAKKKPAAIAAMRLPWLFATLLIEIAAGFVVHSFSQTLASVILLASFMPIISAISGNVGLQAAAIVIRGLATGHVKLTEWKKELTRELLTDLLIGLVLAAALAIVAFLWSQKITFGLVVGLSMLMAMTTAGLLGTLFPMLSKAFGFDPAASAGPFETAFQDVVGFFVFLSLATWLLHWLG